MMKSYDAIIIGGGILGCASAYELAKKGLKVLLLEKNYIGSGSTGRCIGGIRQQFSTPTNIKLAMMSVNMFDKMKEEFDNPVEWHNGGYLFLATSTKEKNEYIKAIKIQKSCGLEVNFINRQAVINIVPQLDRFNFIGGAYCPTDGQANPFAVLLGYVKGIKKLKGKILSHAKVVKITTNNSKVNFVETENGNKYSSAVVINAGGPWAKEVHQLVDKKLLPIPIEPECHEAMITESVPELFTPMIVSYSPGCYFQQLRYTGQIIGCYTPDEPIKGTSRDSSFEFLPEYSQRMLKVMPCLAEIKVIRSWTGWYEMSPDGNPIIGETEIEGLLVIGGASGHGFMWGPALGKIIAGLIVDKNTSIPLHAFSINRKFKKKEVLK